MGRQSSRLWFGRDHKDIFYNGNYHDAMYLTDKNANVELVWQKLKDDDYFAIRVVDYMADYETGELPPNGEKGFVSFNMGRIDGNSYTIDWGDGTVTENVYSHTYPTQNGTHYTVKIYGKAFQFRGYASYAEKVCSCIVEILTPIKRGMSVQNYDLENGTPSYSAMFSYSSMLKQIPVDLFDNVREYEMLTCNSMFSYCGLDNVPIGLFDGVKNWIISGFYSNCDNIIAIPSGAFSSGTFYPGSAGGVFRGCSNLRYVYDCPAGTLPSFEGTSVEVVDCYLVDATSVNSLFKGLTTLREISDNLFKRSPNITSLTNCFSGCTNLESIPEGLFDGLELLEDVSYCFYNCTSIKEIPHDLFHDCFSANNFLNCFYMSGIEEIPSDLLASVNGSEIIFEYMFAGTPITAIPLGLFDGCKENSNFRSTFSGCGNVISSVPDLWNFSEDGDGCFRGCFNASNYGEIPNDWK